MSTDMYARTMLVEWAIKDRSFASADDLMRMESTVSLRKRYGLHTFFSSDVVVNEVYGLSRRNYFSFEVARLCREAGIQELKALQGDVSAPAQWKLPMGTEDADEEAYGYACGYWFAGAA